MTRLSGVLILAVVLLGALAYAGDRVSVQGMRSPGLPVDIRATDAGELLVTGTITTTPGSGAQTVQGQDGGYPVQVFTPPLTATTGDEVLLTTAAVTSIPTSALASRKGLLVQNNGPNLIRCTSALSGAALLAAPARGLAVYPAGGEREFVVSDGVTVRCIATVADQVTGAALNYEEGK